MQQRWLFVAVVLCCLLHASSAVSGWEDGSLALQPSPVFLDASAQTYTHVSSQAPITPCQACRHLIRTVAEQTLHLSYNRNDIVIAAQTVCQQSGLAGALKLPCTIYDEVDDLLARGNFVSTHKKINYTAFMVNPDVFCVAVEYCGKMNITKIDPRILKPEDDGRSAVIMRLKLRKEFSSIARSSPLWADFVKSFLGNVAQTLSIPPQRLELHMHPRDELAEIVIKRAGNAADPSEDDGVSPAPEFLARRFRVLVDASSNAVDVSKEMLNMIDRSFTVQIVPLVVFPTIDKPQLRAQPPRNHSGPSCRVRLITARKSCGDTFRCAADCKRDFEPYLTHCLSSTLAPMNYQRVVDSFNEFFRICESCTPKRDFLVRDQCILNSTTSQLPFQCTFRCSSAYVPYYDQCLYIKMEEADEKTRAGVEKFYQSCQKCTQARLDQVHALCNPYGKGFPSTCTANCSTPFKRFYEECLDWQRNLVSRPFVNFREECLITDAGGLGVRVRVDTDIATITNLPSFRVDAASQLATALDINSSRVEATLVTPVAATSTTGARIDVDFMLATSDNASDPSPIALLDRLHLLVSSPSSRLYRSGIFSATVAGAGVQRLVGNTSIIDQKNSRTPLEVAQAEFRRARQANASIEIRELWAAIVQFQLLTAKQNISLKDELEWRRAIVDWRSAIAESAPPAEIYALQTRVKWLEAIKDAPVRNATDALWGAEIALRKADYLVQLAVAKNGPETQIDMLKAVRRLRAAQRANATKSLLEMERARVTLLTSIFRNESKAKVDQDRARFVWLSSLAPGSTASWRQRQFYYSLFLLMRSRFVNDPQLTLDMYEANVTYRKALVDEEPEFILTRLQKIFSRRSEMTKLTDETKLAEKRTKILKLLTQIQEYKDKIAKEKAEKLAAQEAAAAAKNNESAAIAAAFADNTTNTSTVTNANTTSATSNASTVTNASTTTNSSFRAVSATPQVTVNPVKQEATVVVSGDVLRFSTATPEEPLAATPYKFQENQQCELRDVAYTYWDEKLSKRMRATRKVPFCHRSGKV